MKFLVSIFLCYNIVYLTAISLKNPKYNELPTKETCGLRQCDVSPWPVFIPLQSRSPNPSSDLRCAGALINRRYVITNKSCLMFVLTKVHLGQHDLKTNSACDGKPVLIVDVEEKIASESHQFVLLRLAKTVEYTKSIRPICLPFDEFKPVKPSEEVYASGWGLFNHSSNVNVNILKEVRTTVLKNEECKKIQNVNLDNDSLLCIKQGATTKLCNGDEGGPIMHNSNGQWVLDGILHLLFDSSNNACKLEEPIPSARVTTEVLEWIAKNIRK